MKNLSHKKYESRVGSMYFLFITGLCILCGQKWSHKCTDKKMNIERGLFGFFIYISVLSEVLKLTSIVRKVAKIFNISNMCGYCSKF
jgi:hypothetical protein